MAWYLNYSFFHIWLYKVTFLNDDLFSIFLVDGLFDFDQDWLWFLTVAMLGIVDRLFDHNFCNFGHFIPFDNRLLNFNELYLSLDDHMVDWPVYNLEFGLFIHFGHSLLNFEYFIYFFVNILGHLSLHFDFSGLYLVDGVGHIELLLHLFSS